MKRTLNILIIILLVLFYGTSAYGQMPNAFGIGLRGTPDGGGITGKYFLNHEWALEGQLNASGGSGFTDNDGPSVALVGLMEYNWVLPDPSWRIFAGPGLHAGTWDRYNDGYFYYDNTHSGTQGIFGIDGIVGVEYIFRPVPIGISADVKPALNFARDFAFFPNNFFGLSGRYYFGTNMQARHKPMHARN